MFSWRAIQQLKYLSLIVGAVLIVASIGVFFFLRQPGTCFDGRQNNDELGVDCGGTCPRLCASQIGNAVVSWARALPVRDGVYDAVALIENPNFNAGVKKFGYTFKLYDSANVLIGERKGSTYLNPKERFVIYEAGIQAGTGVRLPRQTFFEPDENIIWERITLPRESQIIASATSFEEPRTAGAAPKVKTTLVNKSSVNAKNLEVVALLFDDKDNLIDASKTTVFALASGESIGVVFLLSSNTKTPSRIDIFPRRNMFR